MAKVSVIIPMYNATKYITGCVDSLLQQTIGDVEVIVVDDCSTDGCMKLCHEKYDNDPRVVLVQQPKNMGPGQARNAGLKAAGGEYLAFVDADDGMLPEALEAMYEVAKKEDADVVHVGGCLVPYAKPMPDNLSTLGRDHLLKLFMDRGTKYDDLHVIDSDIKTRIDNWLAHHYHWNVWGKLYRTSLIREHNIDFSELPLSEDQNFCFRCLVHAKNYTVMPGNFYIYRISADSISRGAKTPAFLAKTLRALFGISKVMESSMEGIAFFEENPEYRKKILDYCLSILEESYVCQAFQSVGRKEAETNDIVCDVFTKFFGANAQYVSKLFYDHFETLPEADDLLDRMNHYEFWEEQVKAGTIHFLEES